MISTGFLFKPHNSVNFCPMEFKCLKCNEKILVWNKKFEDIIQEVLREENII